MLLVGALPCAVRLVGMKLVGMGCLDGMDAWMLVFGVQGSSGFGYILASSGEPGSGLASPRTSGQPRDAQAPRVPA